MSQKLIITKDKSTIISAFYQGMDMVQVSLNPINDEEILGNIYLGKVKNIVKNINAAFVEIADGRMCYYSLTDNPNPIMANQSKEDEENKKNIQIKLGDELIVQVIKEEVKSKAPVVSSNISITGKYLALTHGKSSLGVSTKIEDSKERKRLRDLIKSYSNKDYGFIVRTNSAFVDEELITKEISCLIEIYKNIRSYGIYKSRFSLLYRTPPAYICDIRDGYSDRVDEFVTDDIDLYENMRDYLVNHQPEDKDKLRLYQDTSISLSSLYGIKEKIKDAIKPMVWLKSGGSLVIQPTEALTVIDVNTGKAVAGKKKVQETFLRINLEAAKEIARQIRLRNISGIIIIDFIDMALQKNKDLLMEELEKEFKKDPIKTTLVDMTALGLVEVTRKKLRKPLHEQVNDGS
ncbi:MAG: ribonuclease E/G [Clostridiales bacterium]|nr:ribonuclease E/G [Bacillota bacterium]NLK03547.1 ribonuclease E/G [Clostridiales bacterium]